MVFIFERPLAEMVGPSPFLDYSVPAETQKCRNFLPDSLNKAEIKKQIHEPSFSSRLCALHERNEKERDTFSMTMSEASQMNSCEELKCSHLAEILDSSKNVSKSCANPCSDRNGKNNASEHLAPIVSHFGKSTIAEADSSTEKDFTDHKTPDSMEDDASLDACILSLALKCIRSPENESIDLSPVASPSTGCPAAFESTQETIFNADSGCGNLRGKVASTEINSLLDEMVAQVVRFVAELDPSSDIGDQLPSSSRCPQSLQDSEDDRCKEGSNERSRKCLCSDCQETFDTWSKIFPVESISHVSRDNVQFDEFEQRKLVFLGPKNVTNDDSSMHLSRTSCKPFNLLKMNFKTFLMDHLPRLPSVVTCESSSEPNPEELWKKTAMKPYSCEYSTSSEENLAKNVSFQEPHSKTTLASSANSQHSHCSSKGILQCSVCKRRFPHMRSFSVHAAWHRKIGEVAVHEEVEAPTTPGPSQGNSIACATRSKKSRQLLQCRKCFRLFGVKVLRDSHEASCVSASLKSVQIPHVNSRLVDSDPEITVVIDSDDFESSTEENNEPVNKMNSRGLPTKENSFNSSAIFQCDKCDFISLDRRRSDYHAKTHRNGHQQLRKRNCLRLCPHCKAQLYGRKRILTEHIELFHKNVRRSDLKKKGEFSRNNGSDITCEVCNRHGFSAKELLLHTFVFHRRGKAKPSKSLSSDVDKTSQFASGRGRTKPTVWNLEKSRLDSLSQAMDAVLEKRPSAHQVPRHSIRSFPSVSREPLLNSSSCDSPLQCKKCFRTFREFVSYKNHIIKVHRRVFCCSKCDYMASTSEDLSAHQISHSSTDASSEEEEESLKCPFCDFTGRHRGLFSMHLREHRNEWKQRNEPERPLLNCQICKFSTPYENVLREHRKIHEKRKCPLCNFSCFSKKNLIRHLRKHRALQAFKLLSCSYCNFSTHHRGIFSIHMKSHVSSDEHACAHCDFKTNKLSVLRFHNRKHLVTSGETIFECAHCNYIGKRKRDIRIHAPLHLEPTSEKSPEMENSNAIPQEPSASVQRIIQRFSQGSSAVTFTLVSPKKSEAQVTTGTKRLAEGVPDLRVEFEKQVKVLRRSIVSPPPIKRNSVSLTSLNDLEEGDASNAGQKVPESADGCLGNNGSYEPIKISAVTSLAGSVLHAFDQRHSGAKSADNAFVDSTAIEKRCPQKKKTKDAPRSSTIIVSDRIVTNKQPKCVKCNKRFSNHVDLTFHRIDVHAEQEDPFVFEDNDVAAEEIVSQQDTVHIIGDESDDSDIEYLGTYEFRQDDDKTQISCRECNLVFDSGGDFDAHMMRHASKDNLMAVDDGDSDIELIGH